MFINSHKTKTKMSRQRKSKSSDTHNPFLSVRESLAQQYFSKLYKAVESPILM